MPENLLQGTEADNAAVIISRWDASVTTSSLYGYVHACSNAE